MKKQTLLIIIVIVLLVAIPVCWFGLALGNPLSEYLAKRKAEKILSTGKYGNDYVVDEVYFQINDANYVLCDEGVIIEANYTDYLRIKEAVND